MEAIEVDLEYNLALENGVQVPIRISAVSEQRRDRSSGYPGTGAPSTPPLPHSPPFLA